MKLSTTENPNPEPICQQNEGAELRDQLLTDIRSGRRLEKIASSIESFLNNQVERLEKALSECEAASDNDRIVQKILADFECEKRVWEDEREAEVQRLQKAGEELIVAWEQLENERKNWLTNRK